MTPFFPTFLQIKMPSCLVKSCKNNSTNRKKADGITFHCIPKLDGRRIEWIEILRKSRNNVTWQPSDTTLICSAHFEECDFYITTNGLRRLSRFAIPRKNLFHPSHGQVQVAGEPSTPSDSDILMQSTSDITVKAESTEKNNQPETENLLLDSSDQPKVYTMPLPQLENLSRKKSKTKVYGNISYLATTVRQLKEKLVKKQAKLEMKDNKIKALNQKVRRLTKKVEILKEKLKNVKPENYVDISVFLD